MRRMRAEPRHAHKPARHLAVTPYAEAVQLAHHHVAHYHVRLAAGAPRRAQRALNAVLPDQEVVRVEEQNVLPGRGAQALVHGIEEPAVGLVDTDQERVARGELVDQCTRSVLRTTVDADVLDRE